MEEPWISHSGQRPARLLVACGAATALLGCAGGGDTGGMTTDVRPAASSVPAQAAGATGGNPLDPLGEPTTGSVESADYPGTGEPALLTDVRAAGQETFDRVVLEFDEQVPEYHVEYVEPPITQDGSGHTVDVPGEVFLQITAQPAAGVDLSGGQPRPTYDGPARIDPPYADVITEVVRTGDFEGVLTWTVGLEQRVPYGVVTLEDPARLVVDLRHEAVGDDRGEGLSPVGEGTTEDLSHEGTGEPVTLTDVRLGAHEGFERVVFEFAGGGEPGWDTGYVEDPTQQGSGHPIEVPGNATLGIGLTNVALPGDAPSGVEPWEQQEQLSIRDGQVVEALVTGALFEGRYGFYAGLEGQRPYAVALFEDPQRLVIDILADASIPPVGEGGTEDVAGEGTGSPVVLTDVRLGAHDGFDRIVFELAGDGEAGYEIGYVEEPAAQGSGDPVEVDGDATLGLTLTGILLPPDAPEGVEPWDQEERLAIEDAQVLQELVVDGLFEGRYAFYAGLDQMRPFAVERFDDPQRIVVDLLAAQPGGGGGLGESCTSPAGFSVGYPSDWSVNAGETVVACSRFAPSEFDLPEATDVRVAATAFSIEPVAFDRVTQERPGEVARDRLTVDGRDAVRIEREVQEGLYPVGTPITTYAVELAPGEDGQERTLIADTVGLPGFDHERDVEVLDAQVESLDLDAAG